MQYRCLWSCWPVLGGCHELPVEGAHDHVDKDQHSANDNIQLDPEVLHSQGEESDHGAHKTKDCGQLSHEEVLLHHRLAGGPQAVALAARPGGGNLRYSVQYRRQDIRQYSGWLRAELQDRVQLLRKPYRQNVQSISQHQHLDVTAGL